MLTSVYDAHNIDKRVISIAQFSLSAVLIYRGLMAQLIL